MTTSNISSSAAVTVLCATFVADLTALLHEEAVANVVSALGTGVVPVAKVAKVAKAPAVPGAKRRGRPPGSVATKRDPAEQAANQAALIKHIAANPGQRMEEVSAAIGKPTKDLAFAVKTLLDGGQLVKEGQKRATTYTVAVAKAPAAPKAKAAAKPKKRVKRAAAATAPTSTPATAAN